MHEEAIIENEAMQNKTVLGIQPEESRPYSLASLQLADSTLQQQIQICQQDMAEVCRVGVPDYLPFASFNKVGSLSS